MPFAGSKDARDMEANLNRALQEIDEEIKAEDWEVKVVNEYKAQR